MKNKHQNNCQLSIVNYQLNPGFTLMEVVMAIAIFAIGMVAVAAIFPVAIHLQHATVTDIHAQQFESNTKALVLTRGFEEDKISSSLGGATPPNLPTSPTLPQPDYNVVLCGPNTMDDGGNIPYWSLSDRSFSAGGRLTLHKRHLFWIPLFFKRNPGSEWRVFIFIVTNGNGAANYTATPNNQILAYANVTNSRGGLLEPSDNLDDPPAIPRVAKISVENNKDSNGVTLSGFTNKNGDVLRIKNGDFIICFNSEGKGSEPTKYQVFNADANSITISSEASEYIDTIWAALPGRRDNGEYASSSYIDIIGPLTNDSNNLIHN